MILKMKMKRRSLINSIIRQGNPQTIGQDYGSVVLCLKNTSLYIAALDFYFEVPDLANGLVTMMKLFYALDIHYPTIARSLFAFLEHVSGKKNLALSISQRQLLDG